MVTPGFIPIRLTLPEICAASLMEAADGIEAARDTTAFQNALAGNHAIWLQVREVVVRHGWGRPPLRDCDIAIAHLARLGRDVTDADVNAVMAINRRTAADLAGCGNLDRVRTRIRLAHAESGSGDFLAWLLIQVTRRNGLQGPWSDVRFSQPGVPRPRTKANGL